MINYKKTLSHALFLVCAFTASGELSARQFPVFSDGDRICFMGDSITNAGDYMCHINLYYATRFPQDKISFYNCGISGDVAPGVLSRMDNVFSYRPTAAALMIGLNDARAALLDPDKKHSEDELRKAAAAQETYRDTVSEIMDAVLAKKVKLIAITPSIYDDTVEVERKRQPGRAKVLQEYADFIRQAAAKRKAPVADFHSFMLAINAREQAKNPKFTVVGEDRVHPTFGAAFVMAYKFLKDTGVPALVSGMEIDAADANVLRAENCKVAGLKKSGGALEFSCRANALPMPLYDDVLDSAKLVDFYGDLNREMLLVKNLDGGKYALSIDGKKVGEYSARELAQGVNLAQNPDTPQMEDAKNIAALVRNYRNEFRDYIVKVQRVEHSFKGAPSNPPLSAEEYKRIAREKIRIIEPRNDGDKRVGQFKEFIKLKDAEADILKSFEKLNSEINAAGKAAVGKTRTYKLEKLNEG